jgi:hypothetical protein
MLDYELFSSQKDIMTCPIGEKLLFLKNYFYVHVTCFMIFDMFYDIFSLFSYMVLISSYCIIRNVQ